MPRDDDSIEEIDTIGSLTAGPESADAVSTDSQSSADDLPSDSESLEQESDSQPAALSPHQLKRRRRYRQIIVAGLLTAVFIGTVLWSRGVFDDPRSTQVLSIAPSVLFEQLCAEIRQSESKKLHVADFEVDDSVIPQISDLESIETLILDKGVVTDESIKTISKLPNLQHLRLRLSPIGDEGLKLLSTAQRLWYLNLPHAQCTAEGVGELATITQLRQLRLGSSSLSNEVAREITTITSLRGIHLIGIAITDEGLKTLAAMPHLESLYLDDSAVTEAGWDWLFQEYPHLHVHIDQSHHDRDPKAHKHH